MLEKLKRNETLLIERIRVSLTRADLSSYDSYRRGPGYRIESFEDVSLTKTLKVKNWLVDEIDILFSTGDRVWLTEGAWKNFGLEEWREVENEIIEQSNPDDWGSWA